MNKKQKIFIAISIGFFVVISLVVWDMARQTTKPWGKKKQEQVKP